MLDQYNFFLASIAATRVDLSLIRMVMIEIDDKTHVQLLYGTISHTTLNTKPSPGRKFPYHNRIAYFDPSTRPLLQSTPTGTTKRRLGQLGETVAGSLRGWRQLADAICTVLVMHLIWIIIHSTVRCGWSLQCYSAYVARLMHVDVYGVRYAVILRPSINREKRLSTST